jgi:hypothetical protein
MDFIWTCLWLLTDLKTWLILIALLFVLSLFTPGRRF